MGLFNFRTFAIMALCFAVFAFAAPAAIEKRLDISLNTAPIVAALTQLSTALSGALASLDDVQKGVVGSVSALATNVSIVGNAVVSLTLATAAAALAKTLALGGAAGNVAVADANVIIGQVNTVLAQTTTLANGLISDTVTKAVAADGVANALLKTAVTTGVATLGGVITTLGGVLGGAAGQGASILTAVKSLITLLQNLKVVVNATVSTSVTA
jgi:hypothetical protein